MRLTCPACGAAYAAPEGAIGDSGRWVRCGVCRAEWLARREAGSTGRTTAAPAPPQDAAGKAPAPPAPQADPAGRLSSAASRTDPGAALASSIETAESDAKPSGARFMAGLAVAAALVLVAVLGYVRHDQIAMAAPQLSEPLAAYVDWVDRVRAALQEATRTRDGA